MISMQLEIMEEGKKWDAVKSHTKKNWKKYAGGAAAIGAAAAGVAGAKYYKGKPKQTQSQRPALDVLAAADKKYAIPSKKTALQKFADKSHCELIQPTVEVRSGAREEDLKKCEELGRAVAAAL